jgi:hypothetical protein
LRVLPKLECVDMSGLKLRVLTKKEVKQERGETVVRRNRGKEKPRGVSGEENK